MSWPFDSPENDPNEDEFAMDCDFGLTEFCEEPLARSTGCTVNCELYLKSYEELHGSSYNNEGPR